MNEVRARCIEVANRSLQIPPHVIAGLESQLSGDTEIPLLLLEEPLLYRTLKFRIAASVEFVKFGHRRAARVLAECLLRRFQRHSVVV